MENFVKKRKIRIISAIFTFIICITLAVCGIAYASTVTPVTNFNVVAITSTSISMTWTLATSSNASATIQTIIRYRTDTYPTTYTDGAVAYNGTLGYATVSGLAAGNTYYLAAWGYDGASYSTTSAQQLVNTLAPVSSNDTVPVARPTLPAQMYQVPSSAGWNLSPIFGTGSIFEYFTDPTYTHGGLGMPTDNALNVAFSIVIAAMGLIIYIRWHNFFAAFAILFVATCFGAYIGIIQLWILGVEIAIGAGVWAVEHNFQ